LRRGLRAHSGGNITEQALLGSKDISLCENLIRVLGRDSGLHSDARLLLLKHPLRSLRPSGLRFQYSITLAVRLRPSGIARAKDIATALIDTPVTKAYASSGGNKSLTLPVWKQGEELRV
jgi:hypothetical protein